MFKSDKNYFIHIAFLLSLLYWFYLACTAQMIIVHDATGYENSGQLIHQNGFIAYLKTRPTREPLYPLLLSLSMNIGKLLSVSYQSIQIILQFFLLFLTQCLTHTILKKLQVRPSLIFLSILYIGFSPALVNAALSSFSEIVTFPLITGIILLTLHTQNALKNNNIRYILFSGFLLGLLFLLITCVKGAYATIFLFFLIPHILLFIILSLKKQNIFNKALLSLAVILLGFHIPMTACKLVNKKINGHYAFLNNSRASYVLYNSASLRAEKLTSRRILAALTFIPDPLYCNMVFEEKECSFWTTQNLESFRHSQEAKKIEAQFADNPAKADAAFLKSAKEKIQKYPFQFTLLMGIDAIKLFFWETTNIGFVVYPKQLTEIFNSRLFSHGIRFITSLLSLCSFFYLLKLLAKNRNLLNFLPYYSLLILIITHIALYAFCAASISRHALPIAPLLLLSIALSMEHLLPKQTK